MAVSRSDQTMRTFLLTALTGAVLTTAGLSAQTPTNLLGLDPNSTTGLFTVANTDVLLPIYAEQFRGVGQVRDQSGTIVQRASEMLFVIQDQETNTADPFTVVILPDDGTGQPDSTPANEFLRVGPLAIPVGFMGGGAQAGLFGITFATPFDGLPADDDFYFGLGLNTAATFPADGLTLHGTDESPTGPGATRPFNWTIDRNAAPVIGNLGMALIPRVFLAVENPVLSLGARFDPTLGLMVPDPNYGPVGTYRDPMRGDGLAFRIEDTGRPNAPGALFVSLTAFTPTPLPFPFLEGAFLLDFGTLVPGEIGFTTDAMGLAEFNVGALPFTRALGNPSFQVVTLDLGAATLHVSNAISIIE